VAPVTREGATHWPVYLPEGRWQDFWTHEVYDGPRGITVEAPLDRLPLFVRAGAIVPMGPPVQHLSGPPADDLTLLVYPAASSSFTLYDDDGVTNAYRRGGYALTDFECTSSPSGLVCRIAAPRGAANAVPRGRNYTLQIHSTQVPRQVSLQGVVLHGVDAGPVAWWHDGAFLYVRLGGGSAQGAAEVAIDW
jgi:alpha-glucosidase (family GH31 glycosyl hydrolase)